MSELEPQSALLMLPPNRVRRNYLGGAGIDRLLGREPACDGDQPEDWVASTVAARNPGLSPVADEGLARIKVEDQDLLFTELLEQAPSYYLGAEHHAKHGADLGFLVKLLDAGMRLHVQAHPTAAFAQAHLNAPYGKFETYYILDVRPDVEPYIRLGFQHLSSPAEWERIVLEQDLAAMDACFEPISVAPGDVWFVPGGLPHALGEGLTVIEVMEPSDLVVRCEFVREGIEVPPPARFMGRDPSFALQIFDCRELSAAAVREHYCVAPKTLDSGPGWQLDGLIGSAQTSCFETQRLTATASAQVPLDDRFAVLIVVGGSGALTIAEQCHRVTRGDRLFVAAAATSIELKPSRNDSLELFLCLPGPIESTESH